MFYSLLPSVSYLATDVDTLMHNEHDQPGAPHTRPHSPHTQGALIKKTPRVTYRMKGKEGVNKDNTQQQFSASKLVCLHSRAG